MLNIDLGGNCKTKIVWIKIHNESNKYSYYSSYKYLHWNYEKETTTKKETN